jgi:hypothetical protein
MSNKAEKTILATVGNKGPAVPDKYRRLGSVANAPWFNLAQGNTMEGELLGVYERVNERAAKDPKQPAMVKFFQVKVTTPCEVKDGKGETAEIKQAEVGTIVNLNCNTKTSDLLPCAEEIKHGAAYEVFVACGKKMPLKNGNTMWDITVAVNQTKAPTATADEPDFSDED